MYYDFSNYERTHNTAIDMVANVIACCRVNNQALKAVHLTPIYYEWFKGGVQTLLDRPLLDEEQMEFDGVNIEKGDRFQSKNIVLEYYEQV